MSDSNTHNQKFQCIKPLQPPQENAVRRVIVVEEDQSLNRAIVTYLEMDGYEVSGIRSAHEFFDQFSTQPYDVAILDVDMPEQTGFALVRYLRNNTDTRIISLTKSSFQTKRKECLIAGADVYLEKPVNFRLLSATVGVLFPRLERAL